MFDQASVRTSAERKLLLLWKFLKECSGVAHFIMMEQQMKHLLGGTTMVQCKCWLVSGPVPFDRETSETGVGGQ